MDKFSNKNAVIASEDNERPYWKRRPSEIRGYQRALYCTVSNGDYLRVDYNVKDKRVRLYIEDNNEGGIQYYSVINDGRITVERNLSNGRSISLSSRFSPRAEYFASIPNKEVLKIIGDCYGISSSVHQIREKSRKKAIETTRQRYFGKEGDAAESALGEFHPSKRFMIWDLFDILLCAAVSYFLYWQYFTFYRIGAFLGISAIVIGIVDMFLRNREPIFTKILLLLFSGLGFYIYGYFLY